MSYNVSTLLCCYRCVGLSYITPIVSLVYLKGRYRGGGSYRYIIRLILLAVAKNITFYECSSVNGGTLTHIILVVDNRARQRGTYQAPNESMVTLSTCDCLCNLPNLLAGEKAGGSASIKTKVSVKISVRHSAPKGHLLFIHSLPFFVIFMVLPEKNGPFLQNT